MKRAFLERETPAVERADSPELETHDPDEHMEEPEEEVGTCDEEVTGF